MTTNRTIKKQVWISPQEDIELKRKVRLTGLTEAAVVRILIKDYEPREKPDARFYVAMQEMYAIGNNLNQLTAKAHKLGFIDAPILHEEALKWARFQAKIEAEFLRPVKKEDNE